MNFQEIRCGACRRKLGEGEYTRLAIKCPRCGALNQFLSALSASQPERHSSVEPQKPSNGEITSFSKLHTTTD